MLRSQCAATAVRPRSRTAATWTVQGPTTAAAMAVARRWQTLVMPAVLCGTLGYAVANFIGIWLGNWLK